MRRRLRAFGVGTESSETLEAFGLAFMPILTDMGVELRPPTVHPIRNVIAG